MKRRHDIVRNFRYLLAAGGLFNILMASPLMFPGLEVRYLFFLSGLNAALGFGGTPVVMPAHPAHGLLINTAGIDLVLIGAMVLYAAFDPERRQGIVLLNAIGRLLFAAVAAWYVFTAGLLPLVLLVALADVVFSFVFLGYLSMLRRGW
jgi:hypothetical protein